MAGIQIRITILMFVIAIFYESFRVDMKKKYRILRELKTKFIYLFIKVC